MDTTEPTPVPEAGCEEIAPPRKPLGRWLMENMPQGVEIELPDRSSDRPTPFTDEEDE